MAGSPAPGCKALEGVWRAISPDSQGYFIIMNGYGVEFYMPRAAGSPHGRVAKHVSCSANQARVITLESNPSEQLLQPRKEITFPYRFDGDIFVWQNPQPDGSLGPEYRAERVR